MTIAVGCPQCAWPGGRGTGCHSTCHSTTTTEHAQDWAPSPVSSRASAAQRGCVSARSHTAGSWLGPQPHLSPGLRLSLVQPCSHEDSCLPAHLIRKRLAWVLIPSLWSSACGLADSASFQVGGSNFGALSHRSNPGNHLPHLPILQMASRGPRGAAGPPPPAGVGRQGWGVRGLRLSCRGLPHSTSPWSLRAMRPWCTTWRSSSALPSSRASPSSVGPATPR